MSLPILIPVTFWTWLQKTVFTKVILDVFELSKKLAKENLVDEDCSDYVFEVYF